MIIGIDGNEANIQNRVGVNKYAFEIVLGIYKLLPENSDLIVWVYLKEKPLPDMPKETDQLKYKILQGGKIWIFTKLMPYLLKNPEKIDVFFAPSHYLPLLTRIPMVCSVMDLGYLENSAQFTKKDFWQLKYWTARSITVSKYILTISRATNKDIVRHYPNSKNKIVITYPGAGKYLATDYSTEKIRRLKNKYSIVKDYILYLGTLKPSKNIEGLIDAYKSVVNDYPDYQLVIAGKKGWLYESIFEKVKELGLESKVIFTDFVDESDKPALIKGAKVFLLPSFWEGFGLDVLSAFSLGVPVLASNVGSLPEVVGDAGILVDPSDISSIAQGIEKILNMKKIDCDKMVSKGKMQLRKFSWAKAAQMTLETLRKAVK